MTEVVLRATKLGVIINKLSKSTTSDVTTIKLAKDLVTEWKSAMRPTVAASTSISTSSSTAVSSATFNTSKTTIPTIDIKVSNNTNSSSTSTPSTSTPATPVTPLTPFALPLDLLTKLNEYPEGRKKMVTKFSEYMSMNTTDIPYAFNVGCDIEGAINKANSYDFPDTRKAYSEKCRTLILNLKRNEVSDIYR